jgi:hypothetical protein
MDYCLLERFQGAWLGSILGEALANDSIELREKQIVNYHPVAWLQPRTEIAKSLWNFSYDRAQPSLLIDANIWEKVDRLALLLLPLIILRGESLSWLTDFVSQNNFSTTNSIENLEDVLIWGYAIFLALKEQLKIDSLIDQLLSGVEVKDRLLQQRLESVNWSVAKGIALHEVETELKNLGNPSQVAIAMSLYFLAATPQDFVLTLDRASAIKSKNIATMALTGALGGAWHGTSGIPRLWRIWGQNNQAYRQAESAATELFNAWTGVYFPSNDRVKNVVVSVTGTIQSRPDLQIISQRAKPSYNR